MSQGITRTLSMDAIAYRYEDLPSEAITFALPKLYDVSVEEEIEDGNGPPRLTF